VIPAGSRNYIRVEFFGDIAEKVKRIIGDTQLDFCSLECFDEFRFGKDAERTWKTQGEPQMT